MTAVVERWSDGTSDRLSWWCPGCEAVHGPAVGPGGWSWNGDLERPTLSPSIVVRLTRGDASVVCHSFVIDGVVRFLDDSTHALAGQSVPMRPEHALGEASP